MNLKNLLMGDGRLGVFFPCSMRSSMPGSSHEKRILCPAWLLALVSLLLFRHNSIRVTKQYGTPRHEPVVQARCPPDLANTTIDSIFSFSTRVHGSHVILPPSLLFVPLYFTRGKKVCLLVSATSTGGMERMDLPSARMERSELMASNSAAFGIIQSLLAECTPPVEAVCLQVGGYDGVQCLCDDRSPVVSQPRVFRAFSARPPTRDARSICLL